MSQAGERAVSRLGAAFAFAVPFLANFLYILNHFASGAYYSDSGYLSSILWRNSAMLEGRFLEESFWSSHFSPIFLLFNALSYLLPLGKIEFFALFTGLTWGLASAGACIALQGLFPGKRGSWLPLATCLAAMAFSFNQVALQVISFPHYESLGFSFVILFLTFLFSSRRGLSWLFLALALSVREDFGFHAAGVLILVALLDALRRDPPLRGAGRGRLALPVAVCLGYSLLATALQHAGVGLLGIEHNRAFERIFGGAGPYAHLTAGLIGERALFWLKTWHGLWGPLVLLCLWAALERNPYLLVGYAAFLPWALLLLTARHDLAGRMQMHYGAPFVVSLFWPVAGLALWRERTGRAVTARRHLPLLLALFAWSALAGYSREEYSRFLPREKTWGARRLYAFMGRLRAAEKDLGDLYVDRSVISLDAYPYFLDRGLYYQDLRRVVYGERFPDTVVFFPTSIYTERMNGGPLLDLALQSGPYEVYRVPGTNVTVATKAGRRVAEALAGSGPGPGLFFDRFETGGGARRREGKILMGDGRAEARAPRVDLPRGRYTATLRLALPPELPCGDGERLLTLELRAGEAQAVRAARDVGCAEAGRGGTGLEVPFRFAVPPPGAAGVEVSVRGGEAFPFALEDFDLRYEGGGEGPGLVVPEGAFFEEACGRVDRGIEVRPGRPVVFLLDGARHDARGAYLTLAPGERCLLRFWDGHEPVAGVYAGPLPAPECGGLARFDLGVPAEVLQRGFDAVEVEAVEGEGPATVGGVHL